jgi:hypothetical protein
MMSDEEPEKVIENEPIGNCVKFLLLEAMEVRNASKRWNKFGNKISVIQRHLYVLIVVVTFQECTYCYNCIPQKKGVF